jgi:hypothetical protein
MFSEGKTLATNGVWEGRVEMLESSALKEAREDSGVRISPASDNTSVLMSTYGPSQ